MVSINVFDMSLVHRGPHSKLLVFSLVGAAAKYVKAVQLCIWLDAQNILLNHYFHSSVPLKEMIWKNSIFD